MEILNKSRPEGEGPLLGSDAAALDHDEVLLDLTVVREAAHWVDRLVGDVVPEGQGGEGGLGGGQEGVRGVKSQERKSIATKEGSDKTAGFRFHEVQMVIPWYHQVNSSHEQIKKEILRAEFKEILLAALTRWRRCS